MDEKSDTDNGNDELKKAFDEYILPFINRDPAFMKKLDPEFVKTIESDDFNPAYWEKKLMAKLEMRKKLTVMNGEKKD